MQRITSNKLIGLSALVRDLVTKMGTAGFKLVAVDGKAGSTVLETSKQFYLTADKSLDPLYDEQPWGVQIAVETDTKLSVHIFPINQLNTTTYSPVARTSTATVGRLSTGGLSSTCFIDVVSDWGMSNDANPAAYPLTYDLITTDHGFALHVNAEGFDNTGTAFSWFVCQRGVQSSDTKPGDQSPLFCVFSCAGGVKGNPDQFVASAVQRFVVIEKGVNAASEVTSACQPQPDSHAMINPMQQVSIAPGNRAVVLFPQLLNTQRYVYFATMDMLGYTSADVMSSGSEVTLNPTGATKGTVYRGMNANGKDNRGMRILLPVAVGA